MSGSDEKNDLTEKLKNIEDQLATITPAFTGIVGDRVYQHTITRLTKLGKLALAVSVTILAIVGITSYKEIVKIGTEKVTEIGTEKVTDNIVKVVIPNIRRNIEPRIEDQYSEVQSLIDQSYKQFSERLENELASILQANETKIDQHVTELFTYIKKIKQDSTNQESIASFNRPIKKPVIGYSYFGYITEGQNKTANESFTLSEKDPSTIPVIGDIAISNKSMVIRSKYPEYRTIEQNFPMPRVTEEKIGGIRVPKVVFEDKLHNVKVLEQSEQTAIVGSIAPETKVRIVDVRTFEKYIWVKLEEIL